MRILIGGARGPRERPLGPDQRRQYAGADHVAAEDVEGPVLPCFDAGETDRQRHCHSCGHQPRPRQPVLGADQKAWFKNELLEANGAYPLIVWVNADPWIAEPTPGGDNWGGYTTERRELADFIADNDIEGVAMLSGDAHMIGIDDGTNSDYSTSQSGGFPVFHAGPLDKRPSLKGGPYSEGTVLESGQFGLMTVNDNGSSIDVEWSGRNWKDEEVLRYEFTVPAE